MTIAASDIKYVYSGGTYNADPAKSLGGDPSLRVVWGTTNNLFEDVTSLEAEEGYTDYKCIYVVNNHASDTFYDSRVYIASQVTGGSEIEIGVIKTTEIQQIIVSGIAEGGSFTIAYEGTSVVVNWNLYLTEWAKNLENALNALPLLGGVSVSASSYRNHGSTRDLTRVFELSFLGVNNYCYHPILTLVSNNITGSPTMEIVKRVNGSPINAIAPKIDSSIIEPYGVTWESPSITSPISVGSLRSSDTYSIWVRRYTPPGSSPLASDGFVLRVTGRPF